MKRVKHVLYDVVIPCLAPIYPLFCVVFVYYIYIPSLFIDGFKLGILMLVMCLLYLSFFVDVVISLVFFVDVVISLVFFVAVIFC